MGDCLYKGYHATLAYPRICRKISCWPATLCHLDPRPRLVGGPVRFPGGGCGASVVGPGKRGRGGAEVLETFSVSKNGLSWNRGMILCHSNEIPTVK